VFLKDSLIWFVYNVLFAVGYTLMLPRFLVRMRRRGGYGPGFMQRFGVYDDAVLAQLQERSRIWVHAVSVGEVFVALHFIDALRAVSPDIGFILTTTTSTGHAQAKAQLSDDDVLLYFPTDFPAIARRVVKRLKPVAVLLTECELWPNLLRCLNREQIPVFVINGRISASSFRGYSKVRPFFRRAVRWVDRLFVQAEVDRERLLSLGTPDELISVMGSAKYDVAQSDDEGVTIARQILIDAGMNPDGPLFVAGSTWPGEEAAILEIFARLRERHPDLQMILVPRHMERRAEVEALLKESKLTYVKRTDMESKAESGKQKAEMGSGEQIGFAGENRETRESHENLMGSAGEDEQQPCVLLADTTGELKHYYSVGSVIFVGKSLGDNHGGQNPIEPALFAKPIVVGPHMENFPGVIQDFLSAEALIQVSDASELEAQLGLLLSDAATREAYGKRAGDLVAQKRGVVERTIGLIRERVPGSGV
jgi:3-deoxy-D-manno-octulosonic-acid transferase